MYIYIYVFVMEQGQVGVGVNVSHLRAVEQVFLSSGSRLFALLRTKWKESKAGIAHEM